LAIIVEPIIIFIASAYGINCCVVPESRYIENWKTLTTVVGNI
jgi:hypothetical protein